MLYLRFQFSLSVFLFLFSNPVNLPRDRFPHYFLLVKPQILLVLFVPFLSILFLSLC